MQPIRLKSLLRSTLKKGEIYEIYRKHRAVLLWERVCGKEAARISKAKYLRGNRLFVSVKDHIWASQLTNFEAQYIEKFNKLLGKNVVNKIFFRAKPGDFTGEKNQGDEKDFNPGTLELTGEEKEKLQSLLNEIEDEKVRGHAEVILTRSMQLRRWLLENGGRQCFHCDSIVEPGQTFCPACVRELERENVGRLKEALDNKPWLDFEEASKTIMPLSHNLFDRVKGSLIGQLQSEIAASLADRRNPPDPGALKMEIITLAMLKSNKMPSRLKDDIMRDTLPSNMYEFYKK